MGEGDYRAMKAMLADEAELPGDGGGVVQALPRPLHGAERIARLFQAPSLRSAARLRVELAHFNGSWGLLRYVDDVLESAQAFETDGQRIHAIQVQRNPLKLAGVNGQVRRRLSASPPDQGPQG